MNLSPVLLAGYVVLLFMLAERKNKWLFVILPLAYSLPTARSLIGPIPIYWYDCAAGAVLYFLHRTGFWSGRFPRVPPWGWLFAFIFAIFGVVIPIFRYGFFPEYGYSFSHLFVAFCVFHIGFALSHPRYYEYRVMLAKGMVVTLAWLAVVAVIEWRNVDRTLYFNNVFYADFYTANEGVGNLTAEFMTALWSYRAQGPFMNPSNLAIFSVILASVVITTRLPYYWGVCAAILASVNVVTSISRQVMVAVCLAGLVYVILAPVGKGVRNLVIAGALAIAILAWTGGASIVGERFERVAQQGLEEDNVAARLSVGPQRLYNLLTEKPELVITGVGLDADKLASRGIDVQENDAGFVSNSFLLSLYYTGIFGFIAYVALWLWSLRTAWNAPKKFRPILVSIVIAGIFLTFADNTIFKFEAITGWVLFVLGLVAGTAAVIPRPREALNVSSQRQLDVLRT